MLARYRDVGVHLIVVSKTPGGGGVEKIARMERGLEKMFYCRLLFATLTFTLQMPKCGLGNNSFSRCGFKRVAANDFVGLVWGTEGQSYFMCLG